MVIVCVHPLASVAVSSTLCIPQVSYTKLGFADVLDVPFANVPVLPIFQLYAIIAAEGVGP